MADFKIKRALLAVYDKTGISDFARALVGEFGIEIISTGGTAKHLREAGIPVTLVEEVTGFPEMLDGRVKTLHPKIHAAILADRDNPEHMRQLAEHGIEPIDLVVVNLYPFEKTIAKPDCTFEEAIEMIDIGGPCLLRAAAKNHKHVVVIASEVHYHRILDLMRSGAAAEAWATFREHSATAAFSQTTAYDAVVRRYLRSRSLGTENRELASPFPDRFDLRITDGVTLRYGENPHQQAAFFHLSGAKTALRSDEAADMAAISYNNYVDSDAARELCADLDRCLVGPMLAGNPTHTPCACVFVKHTNPCGVALGSTPEAAYAKAYLGDANAAMGGILCCNFSINDSAASVIMESFDRWGRKAGAGGFFLEAWISPFFDKAAVDVIRHAKPWGARVRLLRSRDFGKSPVSHSFHKHELLAWDEFALPDSVILSLRTAADGMLLQTRDLVGLNEDQWKVVSKRQPTEAEMDDLRLAWLVCKHTKSNAITICRDGMLIGNGAGQMSRVMSCRIATWLAKENGHADQLIGAAAASDAFFPFRDGPDILMEAGVTAIIQPGGSKRDEDTIAACDERGVAMIFTGTRHFKH